MAALPSLIPAYIPSPSTNGVSIGSVRLHLYGVMIALGIAAAVWLADRRWRAIGGKRGTMSTLAIWGVPGGLIGSRLYSLATSWQVDTEGHWYRAFEIWRGGLGIWGGVVGGVLLGAVGARRHHLPLPPLLDCVAPALALAQAIGRWGNYFNQELFGRPSNLPWAVRIDNPPPQYPTAHTFQPTFLYESIWDLVVVGLVIWIERRFRIRRGYLIAAYAASYTFGRFFTEYLRIDTAHRFLGLRLNDWTSIVVFAVAVFVLLRWGRAKPGEERAGDPLPQASGADEVDLPAESAGAHLQTTGASDPGSEAVIQAAAPRNTHET
jgi:phosphatidylglycerol---prolipoprotein diacylglyceryl transferase